MELLSSNTLMLALAIVCIALLATKKLLSEKTSQIYLWLVVVALAIEFIMSIGKKESHSLLVLIVTALPLAFLAIVAIEMTKELDDSFTKTMACLSVASIALAKLSLIGFIITSAGFAFGVIAKAKKRPIGKAWMLAPVSFIAFQLLMIVSRLFIPTTHKNSAISFNFLEKYFMQDGGMMNVSSLIIIISSTIVYATVIYILSKRFIKE